MALPFLSLWASVGPRELVTRWPKLRVPVAAILSLVLAFSLLRNIHYLDNWNGYQNAVTRLAESVLSPQDRYFDSVGMVVTRGSATRAWWAQRARLLLAEQLRQGDAGELQRILRAEPKLWILNYRIDELWPYLGPHIERSYVALWPNIMVSGARISGSHTVTFRNYWPGLYTLYDPTGAPSSAPLTIDGRPLEASRWLEPGSYQLALGETGTARSCSYRSTCRLDSIRARSTRRSTEHHTPSSHGLFFDGVHVGSHRDHRRDDWARHQTRINPATRARLSRETSQGGTEYRRIRNRDRKAAHSPGCTQTPCYTAPPSRIAGDCRPKGSSQWTTHHLSCRWSCRA